MSPNVNYRLWAMMMCKCKARIVRNVPSGGDAKVGMLMVGMLMAGMQLVGMLM